MAKDKSEPAEAEKKEPIPPPKKYRKRPLVVEAIQLTFENQQPAIAFIDNLTISVRRFGTSASDLRVEFSFRNIGSKDRLTVENGDWIVKGVAGEFYPVKPEVFEATYDLEDTG